MRKLFSRAVCLLLYMTVIIQCSAVFAYASVGEVSEDGRSAISAEKSGYEPLTLTEETELEWREYEIESQSSQGATVSERAVTVEYYGRGALSALPNSKALLYAYDRIVEGIGSASERFSIYNGENPISENELDTVLSAYRSDHTEHFWLDNSVKFSYSTAKQTVMELLPSYLMTGNELEVARGTFAQVVNSILSEMKSGMSEFETELYLHDRLAESVTYIESENAHNAYGAIVEGKAVCEGYAEALQYLLQLSGIQSFIAVGTGTNSSGATEAHAWNFVRIDGKYYQTDLTWNDHGENIFHAYFNLSDSEMLRDHTLTATAYALPVCDSSDAHYFAVMEGRVDGSNYSVSDVAKRLKNNSLAANFYITGDVQSFINWYYSNIRSIATAAGVSGAFTYGYSSVGREVILTINTCQHTSLTYVPATPASCLVDGNSTAYYSCSCGKWFADGGAREEIEDKASITIAALGHDYTERLTDAEHLYLAAQNCQVAERYWFDCSRCDSNAKNDVYAYGKYYSGTVFGEHEVSSEWTSENDRHFHKCVISGCSYLEDEAECAGGEATCTKRAECSVCGGEHGALAAHEYDLTSWGYTDGDGHAHICLADGCEAKLDIEEHTDTNSDGECDLCGFELSAVSATNTQAPDSQTTGVDKKSYTKVVVIVASACAAGLLGISVITIVICKKRRV